MRLQWIVVDIVHFLLQELWRKRLFGIIVIIPYFVPLLLGARHGFGQKSQDFLVALCLVLSDDLLGHVFLEIAQYVSQRMVG